MTHKPKPGEWLEKLPAEIGGWVMDVHPVARQKELFERKPLTPSEALENLLAGTHAMKHGAEPRGMLLPLDKMAELAKPTKPNLLEVLACVLGANIVVPAGATAASRITDPSAEHTGTSVIITGAKPPEK